MLDSDPVDPTTPLAPTPTIQAMTPLEVVDLIDAHCEWMRAPRSDGGGGYAPRTVEDRRRVLATLHRYLPRGLDDVTNVELANWLNSPHFARWTTVTYWGHMVGFYRWAAEVGALTGDPTIGIRRPPSGQCHPKPIDDPAEIRHALAHSPEPWRSCVMLGLGAGLRANELAEVRSEDITPQRVHIWRGAKNNKERWVETCATLWAWACTRPSGLLVLRPAGRPVTAAWLSKRQQEHWRGIGLPDWHLHRLRHTFCSAMWDEVGEGVDPLAIRDLMGHASLATTQGYARTRRKARLRAVAVLDALLAEHQPDRGRLVPAAA